MRANTISQKTKLIGTTNDLSLANQIDGLDATTTASQQAELKDILDNMEFQISLIGGVSVGKTSLLRKIISNYVEDQGSDNDSVVSISQEMIKHTLVSENNEEVKVVFVSTDERSLHN